MTISSELRTAGPFTGTGALSTYSFAFKVFQASDLLVVRQLISTGAQTTLALTTDYTVSLNADQDSSPGGSITLVAGALATTYTLLITSDVGNLQPTSLTNQGGFYPEVINDSLDRATIQIQQVAVKSGREVSAPLIDGTIDMTLPSAANRASKFLYFGASGEPMAAAGTNTGNNTSPGNLTLTANNAGSNTARDVIFYDNTTETMRILGFGATSKVGIGTANPSAKLNVSTTSATDGIALNGNSSRWLRTYINSGSGDYNPITQANDRIIAFGSSNADVDTAGLSIVPWSTGNNGLRMDASGKVGIGTASPTKKLEVSTASNSLEVLAAVRNANAVTGVAALGFNVSATGEASSTKAGIGLVRASPNGVGALCFYNNANSGGSGDFTTSDERMRITSAGLVGIGTASPNCLLTLSGGSGLSGYATDGTVGQAFASASSTIAYAGTTSGHPYALITGNSEKMRILSAGQVCIGIGTLLSNTSRVNIAYTGGGSEFGMGFRPATATTSTATTVMTFEQSTGTQLGSITHPTTGGTVYNTTSDYRLKTNVTPMSGALDRIDALKPCNYTWIDSGVASEGFIAHELQAVIPQAVTGTKDEVDDQGNIRPQGVDYSRVVPTLTAAIKELKAIVEAQAARIAALEAGA
jgi:hypothetical protein